jgi:hypothetical protein
MLGRTLTLNYGQAFEKQLSPVATLRRLDSCFDLLNARGASDYTWRVTSLIFSASKLFGRGKNDEELASGCCAHVRLLHKLFLPAINNR